MAGLPVCCVVASMTSASRTPPEPDSPVDAAAPAQSWAEPGSTVYWRICIGLFLAGFATFSLLYSVQPLLPEFTTEFGVSPAVSALALSLSTATLAFAILFAGALSEGWGRRGLMFASMALAALLNILAAVSPSWHALLAARTLVGLLLGGVPAVAMAYLAEETHPRGLGFSMGLYVGGTAFGGMAGRVFMSFLTDMYGWRSAMVTVGVLDLLAAVGFLLLLPRSRNFVRRTGTGMRHHFRAWGRHWHQPRLRQLFIASFCLMGVFVTLYNYVGFRLLAPPYDLSQSEIGLIFLAYIFAIFVSPMAGWLADRLGRGKVLAGGVGFLALGLACTGLPWLAAIVLGIILLTIGFFVAHSTASGWVGRLATENKGHAASLYLLAYYLGSSVVGACGGWFWEHGGWWPLLAFLLALLGWMAWVIRDLLRGQPA